MPAKILSGCNYRLLVFGLFFSFISFAIQAQQKSISTWHLDATINGVQFYHSLTQCNGKKVVFLKMMNTNRYKVDIAWEEVFDTQFENNIDGLGGRKKISLQAGESTQTNCTTAQKKLIIQPEQINPTYVPEVSSFKYKGISVSRVK